MGGVDLGDQLIAVYDPQVRSVKLWKKILINFLLTASVNAYQTFMNTHGRTTPRLDFHMSLLHSLVGNSHVTRRTGRPRTQPPSRRLTGRHFIEVLPEGRGNSVSSVENDGGPQMALQGRSGLGVLTAL
ncbi:uncharacterized protein LOC124284261 [Haliotis rubra]|uniref:uncharacterized protein LOC124284261 n=1 Tax=Haliotis rubra TaxID=36100 RepID=UPI001EE5B726|nr:uncharacterized protein LOC124284261 [Haliotis rubra]